MSILVPGRRRQRLGQPTNNYAVTVERARCLAEIVGEPRRHTHRFIEQLSFTAGGGQQWHRLLQIQIPTQAEGSQPSSWIVPLGPYRRRRFPDISVTDAKGQRLLFVTRNQHGVALTKAILTKHVTALNLPSDESPLDQEPTRQMYGELRRSLHTFYTELGNDADRATEARKLVRQYEDLLPFLGEDHAARRDQLADFSRDLAAATTTTQYLCWVRARPGEVVQLRVTHSTRDPKHKLERGTVWGSVRAIAKGVFGAVWGVDVRTRQEIWNRWYVQYGLAPIPYTFNNPTYDYTISYYLTLTPPDNTVVEYLDWEWGNSWDNQNEVDSSLDSAHIFQVDPSASGGQSITTRAYLRCSPAHHKLLLGTALISLTLVVLLAVGRFPTKIGNPLEAVLTATPSILVAYLAQQQRHYYAHALRRVRGILWGYLVVEVIFLMAVAFSDPVDGAGTPGVSWKATIAAGALAATSTFVFVWQLPLGPSYERAVRCLTRRKKEIVDREKAKGPTRRQLAGRWLAGLRWNSSITAEWQCYVGAVEQYCRLMRRVMIASVAVTLGLLVGFWHPANKPEKHASPHSNPGGKAVLVEHPLNH